MNYSQIKYLNKQNSRIDTLQVNIKLPQQLHTVHTCTKTKSKPSTQKQIAIIKQDNEQKQQIKSTPHKIRHIESIDDKGEFIDQNRQSRVSDKDELKETINRANNAEIDLPMNDQSLQKIDEQGHNQETYLKQLKHINIQKDKDQFNLSSSRLKQTKRKRRLSQSNMPSYNSVKNQFSLAQYLSQQQKRIPHRNEKIVQQEAQCDKKQRFYQSPSIRNRKRSVHTVHRGSSPTVSQQIQRMIVDEVDKRKKKIRKQQQMRQQSPEAQMQEIIEEKQQEDLINIYGLQEARQKIEEQINCLSQVVGHQIGPQYKQSLILEKQSTIKQQDATEQRDD